MAILSSFPQFPQFHLPHLQKNITTTTSTLNSWKALARSARTGSIWSRGGCLSRSHTKDSFVHCATTGLSLRLASCLSSRIEVRSIRSPSAERTRTFTTIRSPHPRWGSAVSNKLDYIATFLSERAALVFVHPYQWNTLSAAPLRRPFGTSWLHSGHSSRRSSTPTNVERVDGGQNYSPETGLLREAG